MTGLLVSSFAETSTTPHVIHLPKNAGKLRRCLLRKGARVIATYRGLLGVFRIDYLFLSDDLVTLHYNAEQIRWSDHNPVVVDLKFR